MAADNLLTREEAWFWLCNLPGFGPEKIRQLVMLFGSPQAIFRSVEKTLHKCGILSEKETAILLSNRNRETIKEAFASLDDKGIRFVHEEQKEYPRQFHNLTDKPCGFYYKGNLPNPSFYSVGIVGARACSGYGKEMTMRFSKALAANKFQIISGMAAGIDACASQGALSCAGKTFVVLGTGVDVIYPRENIELYYQILMNGGGVLSEFPPGSPGIAWHFPHRNRLIAALSDTLLIMEAGKRSGTLTTARYALEQGIDIYALPGRVNDPLSAGCNGLIADGCGILSNPKQLLEDLLFDSQKRHSNNLGAGIMKDINMPEDMEESFDDDTSSRVFRVLNYEPKSAERIASLARIPLADTITALSEMLITGFAKEISKDLYVKN